ncbi:MAG: transcription elongation factor GreA [Firmicutes bacterium]|nr:transcription elongation factor GreA [Bacillota bacterium]
MAETQVLMTREGLEKMKQDLEYLKNTRRSEVADRIKTAIAFGDLSENSEYDDAKNEQAFIEGQILSLEQQLKNAKVVEEGELATDVISEYCYVELQNKETKDVMNIQIVGSVEAKPFENKISNESPVGKAILGHKVGDTVEVNVPAGLVHLKIKKISK